MKEKIGELRYNTEGVEIVAKSFRVTDEKRLWREYSLTITVDGKTIINATTSSREHFESLLAEALKDYTRW